MNANVPNTVGDPHFDGERLLAFSSLLRTSAREIESYVCGGSMGTVLPEGSRIRIRFYPAESFMAGQIVTYIAKDRLVVHRVVQEADSNERH